MNILLISNRYPVDENDPASPFVPDFVRALIALGTRVFILTPQYCTSRKTESSDLHRFDFGPPTNNTPIGSWNIFSPKTWLRVHRFVAAGERAAEDLVLRQPIDHILALWALPSGWFAYHVARKHDIPYSVWCLGSDINRWARRPIFGRITKRVLRGADYVFADGFALGKAARRLSGRPCGFLPSFHRLTDNPLSTKEKTARPPYFLYAGRMHRNKGIYDLLDAFFWADFASRGFNLVYVGEGPELSRMQQAVQFGKLSKQVKILGQVPAETLIGYYRNARAVIIPSRSDSLPLVFSEAIQCGSPVVVYDTGDLGHFVRRFKLGHVVKAGDVSSLSRILINLSLARKNDLPDARAALELLHPMRAARKFLQAIRGHHVESIGAKTAPVKWPAGKEGTP